MRAYLPRVWSTGPKYGVDANSWPTIYRSYEHTLQCKITTALPNTYREYCEDSVRSNTTFLLQNQTQNCLRCLCSLHLHPKARDKTPPPPPPVLLLYLSMWSSTKITSNTSILPQTAQWQIVLDCTIFLSSGHNSTSCVYRMVCW